MYSKELELELSHRWTRIQKAINDLKADACLVATNLNNFYVGGRIFGGYTYIPASGNPIFFVRRPIGLTEGNIFYIRKPEEIADILRTQGLMMPKTLMLEADELTYNEYTRLADVFKSDKVLNATTMIRQLRSIKSPYELELMRSSGASHSEVYRRIPALFQVGMTDNEFSIELERESRLMGSLGIFRVFGQSMEIFMGSVIAGENANTPSPYDFTMGGEGLDSSLPVGANGTLLRPGITVMVDMGGNFTGYVTDMTRTFAIGKIPDIAKRAHQLSIDITRVIETIAKPGVKAADLYHIAFNMAQEAGFADYFMGYKQKAGFVGHGVGMEINELPILSPRSKDVLEEGMAFAFEPKFVIPEVGAVGIENTYIVLADSIERITNCEEELIVL